MGCAGAHAISIDKWVDTLQADLSPEAMQTLLETLTSEEQDVLSSYLAEYDAKVPGVSKLDPKAMVELHAALGADLFTSILKDVDAKVAVSTAPSKEEPSSDPVKDPAPVYTAPTPTLVQEFPSAPSIGQRVEVIEPVVSFNTNEPSSVDEQVAEPVSETQVRRRLTRYQESSEESTEQSDDTQTQRRQLTQLSDNSETDPTQGQQTRSSVSEVSRGQSVSLYGQTLRVGSWQHDGATYGVAALLHPAVQVNTGRYELRVQLFGDLEVVSGMEYRINMYSEDQVTGTLTAQGQGQYSGVLTLPATVNSVELVVLGQYREERVLGTFVQGPRATVLEPFTIRTTQPAQQDSSPLLQVDDEAELPSLPAMNQVFTREVSQGFGVGVSEIGLISSEEARNEGYRVRVGMTAPYSGLSHVSFSVNDEVSLDTLTPQYSANLFVEENATSRLLQQVDANEQSADAFDLYENGALVSAQLALEPGVNTITVWGKAEVTFGAAPYQKLGTFTVTRSAFDGIAIIEQGQDVPTSARTRAMRLSAEVGSHLSLRAYAYFGDGPINITRGTATWSSSNSAVLAPTETAGTFTAMRSGIAIVTLEYQGEQVRRIVRVTGEAPAVSEQYTQAPTRTVTAQPTATRRILLRR